MTSNHSSFAIAWSPVCKGLCVVLWLFLVSLYVNADVAVSVFRIEGARENQGHWEHSIKDQMAVPEPDASAVAKTLTNAGKPPPALLDILELECGVQVGSKAFVVTILERGIEVQQATIANGQMRVTGESRILGKFPEITKILQSYIYKILDRDVDLKARYDLRKRQKAEQNAPSDGDKPSK